MFLLLTGISMIILWNTMKGDKKKQKHSVSVVCYTIAGLAALIIHFPSLLDFDHFVQNI